MASGDTKTEQMLNVLANGGDASQFSGCCNTKTQNYILGAIDRVQSVEDEVEELKNNPDVVDIVDTYADLQAYDTQHLTENDIIRVLQDETHSGNSTYYRFTKNPDTWTFIGEISGGGGVTPVQTTGTSTTDVMSQDATTKMIFPDITNSSTGKILIGSNSSIAGSRGIAINSTQQNSSSTDCIGISTDPQGLALLGSSGRAGGSIAIGANAGIPMGNNSIAIGKNSYANGTTNSASNTALGANTNISGKNYCVALGYGATPSRDGEVNVGAGTSGYGYNSTNYRVIGGVHDGQLAQDAVTVNQVNSVIDAINTALSTNIPHIGAAS